MAAGFLRSSALVGLAISLSACANIHSSEKMAPTIHAMQSGNVKSALMQMGPNTPDNTDLLFNLEYGEIVRLEPAIPVSDSTSAFLKADNEVKKWEDETRLNLEKPAGAFASYALSDSFRTFEGQDYEKSLLSNRLAVNHLIEGDWDSARVEIRKLTDRETLIKNYREAEFDAVSANARKNNVPAVSMETIQGYPVQILNDPEVLGLKNSYQSAAAHYLAGFVFESLAEPSLAAPGYRQAIELRPDNDFLKQSLANLDAPKPITSPAKNKKSKVKAAEPVADSDVLFIVETGTLSPIRSQKVTIPVPLPSGIVLATVAYPVIDPSNDLFNPRLLSAGSQQILLSMVTNIDAMSRRAIRDEMPSMIARSTTRAVVAAAAQAAALNQRDSNGNNLGGVLVALAIGVASAATNDVDTRHWTTLPAQIYMGRARLPQGKTLLALNTPTGIQNVEVNLDSKHQIVYARVLHNGAVVRTSLPVKSTETAMR